MARCSETQVSNQTQPQNTCPTQHEHNPLANLHWTWRPMTAMLCRRDDDHGLGLGPNATLLVMHACGIFVSWEKLD